MPKPHPPEYAVRRFAEALAATGYTDDWLFAKTDGGKLLRTREVAVEVPGIGAVWQVVHFAPMRERIWAHMREDRDRGPVSYPEIARVCGMRGHSSIVEALARKEAKEAAA